MRQHIVKMDIDAIKPNPAQPRRFFAEAELQELANSIRQNGLLQPVVVRRAADGGYELVAGERRLRACKRTGMRQIPVLIANCSEADSAVYALMENLQREDLNMFEEAEALKRLMQTLQLTQEQLAVRLGRAQSTVANKLRLLRLPEDLRQMMLDHALSERHARALLRLPNEAAQRRALQRIVRQKLNVSQSEKLISAMLTPQPTHARRHSLPVLKDTRIIGNTIEHAVKTLQGSGVQAESFQSETEAYVEWVVRIPKQAGKRTA